MVIYVLGAHLPDVPLAYTEARGSEINCTTRAQKQVPVATDMTLTGSDTEGELVWRWVAKQQLADLE